jgi:hypothetical protein
VCRLRGAQSAGLYLDVDPSMFGSMGEADTAADVAHEALARTRNDVDWEAREQERRGEICPRCRRTLTQRQSSTRAQRGNPGRAS